MRVFWINYECDWHLQSAFLKPSGYRRRLPDIDPVPLEPVILNTTPTNYSFIAGETAVLNCPVVNLGTKTVNIAFVLSAMILLFVFFSRFFLS